MSKHPSTRYEGKMLGKKRLEKKSKEKDSAIYYDEEAGHYKKDTFGKKKNKRKWEFD